MTESNRICVEVAYALPDKQEIVMVEVEPGTTAVEAVAQSDPAASAATPEVKPANARQATPPVAENGRNDRR